MRRIRLDLMTKAELSIYKAIAEVECLGADTMLTQAQTLLQQAKDLVSDYVDGQISALDSTPNNPPPPPSGGR